jgi:hypothetical protein
MKKIVILAFIALVGAAESFADSPKNSVDNITVANRAVVRRCSEWSEDESYVQYKECSYPGVTLREVYDFLLKDPANGHLKPSLPEATVVEYSLTDDNGRAYLVISYEFEGANHLTISEYWPESDGRTTTELSGSANGVVVLTTHYLP